MTGVVVEALGPVTRVTLDRPERHNALTEDMAAELLAVLDRVETDEGTRALVLRGGGRSFCSGWDVTGPAGDAGSPVRRALAVRRDNRLFERLWHCAVPTFAQVHGHCLAGGTDLALSCDFVLCARDARIGYPAVRSMGSPATHMWLYHLGPQWTKRLLLTGDSLTGETAARLGLALEAVDAADLDDRVLDLARRVSWVPRDLLVSNKHVVNRGLDLMGRGLLQEVAADQEVLSRGAPGAETFWRTVAESGVRAAVRERDAPFAAGDPLP